MNEHEFVGLYVVEALEEQESKDFEAHLAGCDSCRREVTDMSESLAQLSELTAVAPPPELRASVLAAARQERPTWLAPVPNVSRTTARDADERTEDRPDTRSQPARQVPDELALRRSRRTVRALAVGIAASLVLAVGAAGYAQTLRVSSDRQAEVAISQTSLWAAPDLDVKHVTLGNGSAANYAVSKEQNRAMFVAESMPAVKQGKEFQMWTIRTKEGEVVATPSVTFGGHGPVSVVFDDIADAEQVAITVEPEGGSPKPTTKPFAAVSL